MRVIGGEFRSRLLAAPRGKDTRPTSDRLRETLFNVLGETVVGVRFVDLYAGSGAVGIEALSRGATHCLFVEQGVPAVAAIRQNLRTLQLGDRAVVDNRPVLKALAKQQSPRFDLVFLDPPYEAATEYSAALQLLGDPRHELLAPGGRVVAEHARRATLAIQYGHLQRTRLLEQGDAALSFYALPELLLSPAESTR